MNQWDESMEQELWEPGSSDQPLALADQLSVYRYDPAARPLEIDRLEIRSPSISHRRRRAFAWIAAAAMIALVVQGVLRWRLQWPEGRPWEVVSQSEQIPERLVPGAAFETSSGDRALVRIARIGWMTVSPDSEIALRATESAIHRVALERGGLRVRVWAPPFSLAISTPAGVVTDLGCEFVVRSNLQTTEVEVLSGWVHLENHHGEVLVPAGARSGMSADAHPRVPVYTDASPQFSAAVVAMGADAGAVDAVLRSARPRDALTLLYLAMRHESHRTALLRRAEEIDPRVSAATVARALDGDDRAVWNWIDSLPLPPPKGWVRNWRDAFPPSK